MIEPLLHFHSQGAIALLRLLALLILLLPVHETVAQPSFESDPVFELQTELFLEVLIEGTSLESTVLSYEKDGRRFIALGEFMDAIRFPINTDAQSGQAGGWFVEEEREFLLDLSQGRIVAGKDQYGTDDDVFVFEGEIYVAEEALETWFPLRLELLVRELAINVEPLEPIPVQESLRRRYSRVIGAGAFTRGPELPFQETPYRLLGRHSTDLNINTSSFLADEDASTELRGSYSLLSRGDLAWMTSTIVLGGTDTDELNSGRIKLERNLDRPLLNLDYVEVGDVAGGSRGILLRGGGAKEGAKGTFADESIDLRGDIPPDWEVELYRNGLLIDVQVVGEDAQYEFLEVPLEFGENRFEFILYGPFGEEKRDERIVFAGDGLELGDVSYTLSALQEGESVISDFNNASQKGTEGAGRYLASFNIGLGLRTTARFRVDSFEFEGERLQDMSAGFSSSFSRVQTSLGYDRRERALDQASAQLRGRIGEQAKASVSYSQFLKTDLEEALIPENRSLWSTQLGLSSQLFDNPFNITASHSKREIGASTTVNLGTTLPTPWFRLSKSFFYQREDGATDTEEQAGGSFNFEYDTSHWRFRSGGTYSLHPETEFINVFGSANIRLDRQMSLNFNIGHRPQDDFTNYRMGFNWGLEYVQISPQVVYDSNERWLGLVSLSTSFNPRPKRAIPEISRLSQAGYGAVHARVFLDDNGDGLWDENERGLGDVRVDAIQSYQTARTSYDGNGYLTRLSNDRVTDIAIDPTSLPDPELSSTNPGVSIRPRPGSWSTVDFPVIRTMELEGYIYQALSAGQEPAPARRVLVRLVDQSGDVVSQQRTVFDGFFLFSNVAPGTYSLELRDELEERLIKRPGEIYVTASGGVIRNLDFLIGLESRTLVQPDPEPGAEPERTVPRVITPAMPENDTVTSADLPEGAVSAESQADEANVESSTGEAIGSPQPFADAADPPPAIPVSGPNEESGPSGNWHVQFGAFSQERNARRRWDQLQSSGVLPASQSPRYQSTGNLVRLLTDVGLSEDDARALCNEVRASELGDCLVREIEN